MADSAAVRNTKTKKVKVRSRQNRFVRFFTDKRSNRSITGNIILILVLLLLAAVFLLPVIMVVSNAFKPLYELLKFPPDILVKTPTTRNFMQLSELFASSLIPFTRYLFNTLIIVVFGTVGQIIFASMAAYPLAKYNFWGNKAISKLIVLSLMFSGSVTSIPNYVIMSKLGLIDTYLAILLPAFAATVDLYLLQNFMSSIPNSLIEAASIDGASEFTILRKVIIPAVKPALITVFIRSFQVMWGATGGSFIYKESLKTLNYALGQVGGTIARQGVMAAVSFIMLIIPTVIYIISQSNVLETMTTSGMKE